MFASLGRRVLGRLDPIIDMSALLTAAVATLWTQRGRGDRLVWDVTLRQMLFTGVEALKVVSIVALLLGLVTIVETITVFPRVGGQSYIGTALVLVVVRELGPILTAFIIIGRSGTAVAIEIGNMLVHHEVEAIEMMGIDPLRYIVLPRIVGITAAVTCLALYFNVVALFGGYVCARLLIDYPFASYLRDLSHALGFWDVAVSLLKCLLFGLIVAVICCYHGFSVRFSSTEVPQVTTRAVVAAIYACFAVNAAITVLFYMS